MKKLKEAEKSGQRKDSHLEFPLSRIVTVTLGKRKKRGGNVLNEDYERRHGRTMFSVH